MSINQPMLIRRYNKSMGGVDRLDQNISCYRTSLRKKKWWFSLFTWMLDASVVNAFYIFRQGHQDVSFLDFRRQLVLFYLQGNMAIPSRPGPSRDKSKMSSRVTDDVRYDQKGHFVIMHKGQKQCAHCSTRPNTSCVKCKVALCPKCFLPFHSR